MSVFLSAWEQRKLGKVVELYGGNAFSSKDSTTDGIPWLKISNVSTNGIDWETKSFLPTNYWKKYPEYQLKKGDYVMALTRPVLNHALKIGKVDRPSLLNQRVAKLKFKFNREFTFQLLRRQQVVLRIENELAGTDPPNLGSRNLMQVNITLPINIHEQQKIGEYFSKFDSLITLHQRKPFIKNGGIKMITSNFTCDSLFKDYFEFWIKLYKEGAVRPVTLEKYRNNQKHIAKIIPNLKMKDFDRNAYQELLNQYALTHERQTVIDFHHQVKGAILDAVDDGLIDRDPTRKAIFKGKAPREKKQKYLNQFELHNLLEDLDLGMEITWDWLILLIAKTGLRFSEALGLTPADFDFARQTISVNKTWDYKTNTGFQPTKNRSSIRKVQMDWQLGMQFQHLIKNLNEDEPIFVNGPVCNSTPNNCLARHCRKCGIPEISIHGLRHTHASLLMFAGVSIASVSRRLGHSSITTTQKVYMHIISELENQDNDLVMRYLSSLS